MFSCVGPAYGGCGAAPGVGHSERVGETLAKGCDLLPASSRDSVQGLGVGHARGAWTGYHESGKIKAELKKKFNEINQDKSSVNI